MSNYFVFGNYDTRTDSVLVYWNSVDGAPMRQYKQFTVNGRNGKLLLDLNRYDNVTHKYGVVFTPSQNKTAYEKYAEFRDKVLSYSGYKTLYDSFHTTEFYSAYIDTAIDPKLTIQRDLVKMTVTFSRKPERYLNSGNTVTTLTADGSITNPTSYESKPLLRIYGTGNVYIGSQQITITSADDYTDIDCDAMICFKGTANKGTLVSFSDNKYPVLNSGVNAIDLGTNITKIEITPRWYTL